MLEYGKVSLGGTNIPGVKRQAYKPMSFVKPSTYALKVMLWAVNLEALHLRSHIQGQPDTNNSRSQAVPELEEST